jgi:hypothetical protein
MCSLVSTRKRRHLREHLSVARLDDKSREDSLDAYMLMINPFAIRHVGSPMPCPDWPRRSEVHVRCRLGVARPARRRWAGARRAQAPDFSSPMS